MFHPGGDAGDAAARVQQGFLSGLPMRPMAVVVPGIPARASCGCRSPGTAPDPGTHVAAQAVDAAKPAETACGVWFYRTPGYV